MKKIIWILAVVTSFLSLLHAQSTSEISGTVDSRQITVQGDKLFARTNADYSDLKTRFLSIMDGIAYAIETQHTDRIQNEKESTFANGKIVRKDLLYFYGDTLKLYLVTNSVQKIQYIGGLLSMVGNPKKLFATQDLEIQVNTPGKNSLWLPASFYFKTKDTSPMLLIYESSAAPLQTNEEATIKIRSSKTGEPIRDIVLRRKPLLPDLKKIFHDSTGNSFFEKEIAGNQEIQESFEKDKTSTEKALSPNMPILTSNSRMLWFFKKPVKEFADSTLTFQLIADRKPVFDTAKTTGHMLLLSNLKSNTQYEVKIAYALQPERTVSYYFSMPPLWYEKTSTKIIVFALLALLIGVGSFLYFRKKTRAAERKTEETKQGLASIRAQLNPHFVFNALNSIQALMHNNEIESANNYLGQFSKLLRTSLEPAYQGMIPIQKELELLDQYIAIEQLRLPFSYEKQIAPGLDIHAIEIPGMLLQPLAENAIRHGLNKSLAPHLILIIKAENKDLILQVIDNGQVLKLPIAEGYGLRMVQEKLTLIKQQFGAEAAIFALKLSEGNTVAEIKLSKWIDS